MKAWQYLFKFVVKSWSLYTPSKSLRRNEEAYFRDLVGKFFDTVAMTILSSSGSGSGQGIPGKEVLGPHWLTGLGDGRNRSSSVADGPGSLAASSLIGTQILVFQNVHHSLCELSSLSSAATSPAVVVAAEAMGAPTPSSSPSSSPSPSSSSVFDRDSLVQVAVHYLGLLSLQKKKIVETKLQVCLNLMGTQLFRSEAGGENNGLITCFCGLLVDIFNTTGTSDISIFAQCLQVFLEMVARLESSMTTSTSTSMTKFTTKYTTKSKANAETEAHDKKQWHLLQPVVDILLHSFEAFADRFVGQQQSLPAAAHLMENVDALRLEMIVALCGVLRLISPTDRIKFFRGTSSTMESTVHRFLHMVSASIHGM